MADRLRIVSPSGQVYFADWDKPTPPTEDDLKGMLGQIQQMDAQENPTPTKQYQTPAGPEPAPVQKAQDWMRQSFGAAPAAPTTNAAPPVDPRNEDILSKINRKAFHVGPLTPAQTKQLAKWNSDRVANERQITDQQNWKDNFDLTTVQNAWNSTSNDPNAMVQTKAGGWWKLEDAVKRYRKAFGQEIGGNPNIGEDPVFQATGFGTIQDPMSQAVKASSTPGAAVWPQNAYATNPALRRAGEQGLNNLPSQVLSGVLHMAGLNNQDSDEVTANNPGIHAADAIWNFGRYFLPGGVGGLMVGADMGSLAGDVATRGPQAIGDALQGIAEQNNPFGAGDFWEAAGRTGNLALSLWGLSHGKAAIEGEVQRRFLAPADARFRTSIESFGGWERQADPRTAAIDSMASGAGVPSQLSELGGAVGAGETESATLGKSSGKKSSRKRKSVSGSQPSGINDPALETSPVAAPGVIATQESPSGEAGIAQSPPPTAPDPVHRNFAAAMTDDELGSHKAIMDAAVASGVADPANAQLHQAIADELEGRLARQAPDLSGNTQPGETPSQNAPEGQRTGNGPQVGDEYIVTHGNGQKSRAIVTEISEDGTVTLKNNKRTFAIAAGDVDQALAQPKSKSRPKRETPANPHEDVLNQPIRTMSDHELAAHYQEIKKRVEAHGSKGEAAPEDLRSELSRAVKEARRRTSREIRIGDTKVKVRDGLDLNAVEDQLRSQHTRLLDLERRASEGGPNGSKWATMAEAQRRANRIIRKSAERKLPEDVQARLAGYLRDAGHDELGVQASVSTIAPAGLPQLPQSVLPKGSGSAVKTPVGGRVSPEPIVGGEAKAPQDIILEYGKHVGDVRTGKPEARNALGTYNPTNQNTVIRIRGDLSTAAHELGHRLDDTFGLVKQWMGKRVKSPFDSELRRQEFQHTAPKGYSLAKKRLEGVAEFVRAYLINPDEARRLAPNFTSHFERTVSPEMLAELRRFGDEVRAHAGLTSEEKIKAGHSFAIDEGDGLKARAKRFVANLFDHIGGENYSRSGWKLVLKRTFLDDAGAFLDQAVKDILDLRGVTDILPESDPRILQRQLPYIRGKVEDIFAHGPINFRGQRVGGSFMDIFAPLDQSSHESFLEDLKAALTLATTERALEKGALSGDYSALVDAGAGFYSDRDVLVDAIHQMAMDPERFARLTKAADNMRAFSDKILRYAVEGGRLSEADYAKIKAENQWYSAMQRIVGDEAGDVPRVQRNGKGSGLKAFKGSKRKIRDPLASLLDSTMKIVEETDRNHLLSSLNDLLTTKRGMHQGDPMDLSWFGRKVGSKEPGAIRVYNDGKVEYWAYEKGLHQTFQAAPKGIREPIINAAIGVLKLLPRTSKFAITHGVPYFVRNLVRDTIDRSILTRTGAKISDMFGAATPEETSAMRRHGASISRVEYLGSVDGMEGAVRRMVSDVMADKASTLALPTKLWHQYESFLAGGEIRGRLAEYRSAYRKAKAELGYDDYNAQIYAAHQARDLLDFARAGSMVRAINEWVPFFNAGVQGLDRLARGVRANPQTVLGRALLYAAIPAVVVNLINRLQGDEATEEYSHLPSYQRDMFFNFRVAPGHWLRVAKPFEIGVFGTGFERLLDRGMGNEHAFDGWPDDMQKAFLSQDEAIGAITDGGPFKPFVENMRNEDAFRGGAIIPDHEEGKALDLRDESKASNLGKILGKAFNTDARKMDHWLTSQFADFGRMAEQLSNLPSGKLPPSATVLNDFTGSFTAEPGAGDPDVIWIRRMSKLSGGGNPLKAYQKRVAQAETQADRIAANRDLREAAAMIRKRAEEMADGLRGTERLKVLAGALK